uniref:Upstream stimulatory factor 1 n=1 Tax=Anisakis simplex TaxID=6269 RepID=A0A0M3JKA3_ANISI
LVSFMDVQPSQQQSGIIINTITTKEPLPAAVPHSTANNVPIVAQPNDCITQSTAATAPAASKINSEVINIQSAILNSISNATAMQNAMHSDVVTAQHNDCAPQAPVATATTSTENNQIRLDQSTALTSNGAPIQVNAINSTVTVSLWFLIRVHDG